MKKHIDEVKGTVADDEKRYKTITDMLKKEAISQFKEGDKTVTISGASFDWVTSKTMKDPGYDMVKMQEDGIDIEKYHGKPEPQYRFTPKARKESA